jgi:hypothetical protein
MFLVEMKERVIAFRIPSESGLRLDEEARSMQVVNINSGNMLARKLVLDYLQGKVIYLNEKDRNTDPAIFIGRVV